MKDIVMCICAGKLKKFNCCVMFINPRNVFWFNSDQQLNNKMGSQIQTAPSSSKSITRFELLFQFKNYFQQKKRKLNTI